MSEKEIKTIPFRIGNLDIINEKLKRIDDGIEINILKTVIEPINLGKDSHDNSLDLVAKIEALSNVEPDSSLRSCLDLLIFPPPINQVYEHYPVHLYNIQPFSQSKKLYKFTMDVVLTQMDLYPHECLKLD